MAMKQDLHVFKGMQRDMTVSKVNPEYMYEAHNIRLTATDKDTLLSVTNERGPKEAIIKDISDGSTKLIKGIVLGTSVLNNYLVVFIYDKHSTDTDSILLLEYIKEPYTEDYNFILSTLYKGNLNFDEEHKIETLSVYENEDVQKVYWVDGKNQPRVINIKNHSGRIYNNNSFDFVGELKLKEKVGIKRIDSTSGIFSPGVIQYAISYYNKFGAESNICYTSPLYYISNPNRGSSPEDKVSCSFNIKIDNIDTSFDYLRIYSIQRTSLEATPVAKVVEDFELYKGNVDNVTTKTIRSPRVKVLTNKGNYIDLTDIEGTTSGIYTTRLLTSDNYKEVIFNTASIKIKNDVPLKIKTYYITEHDITSVGGRMFEVVERMKSINYNDTGTTGRTIDPTQLLYIGGESIVASTMTQKDNTLFLGNIKLNPLELSDEDKDKFFSRVSLLFKYEEHDCPQPDGTYPYNNSLDLSSMDIKGFKGGETYRVGMQFQYKDGRYTSPVFIRDMKNTLYPKIVLKKDPKTNEDKYVLMIPKLTFSHDVSVIPDNFNYTNMRLVIATPNISDKSIICQGVLCPTVYNMKDRCSNLPYSASSWFMRFNSYMINKGYSGIEYRHNMPLPGNDSRRCEIQSSINPKLPYVQVEKEDTQKLYGEYYYFSNTLGYIAYKYKIYRKDPSDKGKEVVIAKGERYTYTEARKDIKKYLFDEDIPTESEWRGGSINYPLKRESTSLPTNEALVDRYISQNANTFYVDQSILTFHSPDLEDQYNNLEDQDLKLRIVGLVKCTSSTSDYKITASTSPRDLTNSGEARYNYDKSNLSKDAFGLINAPLWRDSYKSNKEYKTFFATYPWHRSGSLSEDPVPTEGKQRTSELKRKVFSNLRYCYFTDYFNTDKFWSPEGGISKISIFNSNELEFSKVKGIKNYKNLDLNYYGNLSKAVSYNSSENPKKEDGYPIQCSGVFVNDDVIISEYTQYVQCDNVFGQEPAILKYKSTPHAVFGLNYTSNKKQVIIPALNGDDTAKSYLGDNVQIGALPWDSENIEFNSNNEIKYITKFQSQIPSNPSVEEFWYAEDYGFIQVCTKGGSPSSWNTVSPVENSLWKYNGKYYKHVKLNESNWKLIPVDDNIIQDVLGETSEYPFLYMAELYRDIDPTTIYGGKSEGAIKNNLWIPASPSVSVGEGSIDKTEGDTYFQRWDCLKTYAFTNEDKNSVVDITSFMCESRLNLDGRYDSNRGQKSNLVANPTNFNLFNPVYNQSNNFFNYRILDKKFNLNNFPNTITWTKEKKLAEDIDTWTNITIASTLDLDGDKGEVTSLNTYNNEIYCFQKNGFSNILFNSRVQIPTSDGVPIEITNGLKVQGKRYISDMIGCSNKWTICESPNGLYFIDDVGKSINLYNGKINSLSDSLGFSTWMDNHYNKDYITLYDRAGGDVYFVGSDYGEGETDACLCFSETLGQFTSFMRYNDLNTMVNFDSKLFSLKFADNKDFTNPGIRLWEHNAGDYNIFFCPSEEVDDINKKLLYHAPYSIEFTSNADEPYDKIFDTLDFRADTFIGTETPTNKIPFDTLLVTDEYQNNSEELVYNKYKPSNLKKKFRVWRALIPRNKNNRIRNTWARIKLMKKTPNIDKTIFHDVIVNYTL